MREGKKLLLLVGLVALFVVINLRQSSAPAAGVLVGTARPAATRGKASAIPDAELHLDRLEAATRPVTLEATRNIFEYGQRERTAGQRRPVTATTQETPPPPPPPPKPPVRFYGFAKGSAGGERSVFLTDGESVFIAREGDVFLRRFRLTKVGRDNIEIEEIGGPNRWVVPIEQP